MISHVYFDFFGTLVDYEPSVHPDNYNAPYEFARRAGENVSPKQASVLWQQAWDELDGNAQRSGRECSMHEIAIRYWELLGSPLSLEDENDRLVEEYLDAWTKDIRPAHGALSCLEDLSRDYRLSIVTNTHHPPLVPNLVERFGISEFISEIFTSIDVGWRKPDPHMFEHVISRDGITATEAVFVGDNWEADVEGPTRAGMTAFYVGESSAVRTAVTLAGLPQLIRELG